MEFTIDTLEDWDDFTALLSFVYVRAREEPSAVEPLRVLGVAEGVTEAPLLFTLYCDEVSIYSMQYENFVQRVERYNSSFDQTGYPGSRIDPRDFFYTGWPQ